MKQMHKKEENNCINLIKGIACMLVVFIHITFPGKFGDYVYTFASIGVPIFFMISGYYAYSDDYNNMRIGAKRKLKNIVKLTCGAFLLYFVWRILYTILSGQTIISTIKEFTLKRIFTLLVINDVDVLKGAHLWFLVSLIYAYISLIFLSKSKKINIIYPIVLIAFVGRLFVCNQPNWHYIQNFWFDGFPFFYAGIWMKQYNKKIYQIKIAHTVLLFILGVILCEAIYFTNILNNSFVNIYEIGSIIASFMVFVFAQKCPDIGKNNLLTQIGKKYSMYIYIIHVIVLYFIDIYDGKMTQKQDVFSYVYLWIKPFLVFLISLLISVIYSKIKKNGIVKKERLKNE